MIQEGSQIEVLFVDVDEETREKVVVPYSANKHLFLAMKFLYWPAQDSPDSCAILAVGSAQEELSVHRAVYNALFHKRFNMLRSDTFVGSLEGRRLRGAGTIHEGKVTSWEGNAFVLYTPEDLQPLILKALGIE